MPYSTLDLRPYTGDNPDIGVGIYWEIESRVIYTDYWAGVSTILFEYTYRQHIVVDGSYIQIGSIVEEILEVTPSDFGSRTQSYTDNSIHSFIGTNGDDTLRAGFSSDGGAGSQIFGRGGDDHLGGASLLDGGDGNDVLSTHGIMVGGAGDDLLVGRQGADQYDGGAGIDIADFAAATAGVTVSLVTGLASDGDTLRAIENLIGTFYDDTLTGNAGANALSGLAGIDRLVGGDGNDALEGGAGADLLNGGGGTDRADYLNSSAGVTVNLTTNIHTGGDAAGDAMTGIETIGGSNFVDSLTGSAGANTLWGRDGADALAGGAGNDLLYGEAGADTLQGGDGDDWLIGGAGADGLNGGAGTDTANYGDVAAAVTINLLAGTASGGVATGDSFVGVEQVIGSAFGDWIKGYAGANGLWGMAGADKLYGGDGADALNGGDGDDALYGEAGNDVLKGGEGSDSLVGGAGADAMDGGNGSDLALYDAAAAAVSVNLATGGTAGDAAGDSFSGVESVLGSVYADTITGSIANNALWGMAGNDVLAGAGGADQLKGGAGADTFTYNAVSDSTATIRDSINDFARTEGDRISLAAIDADGNAGNGNTAFTFLGSGAFTGAGHEVRLAFSGGVQVVLADLNGDKAADIAIAVISVTTLVAADFVL